MSDILTTLKDAVNETDTLPVAAMTDNLGKDAPAASIQQLPGQSLAEAWIDGTGISEMPFAVSLRVPGASTKSRVDAWAALTALGTALEAAAWTDPIVSVRVESTPVLVERDDHGTEVWRATYMLESLR